MTVPERTGFSRVWSIQWQAAPSHPPAFHAWAKGGAPTWGLGDITRIQAPSLAQYGAFDEVGTIRGHDEAPTMDVTFSYPESLSEILELVRIGCPIDLQLHFGRCANPTNFDAGWEKVVVMENVLFTNYALGDLGALEASENAKIDETVSLSAEWFYEVKKLSFAERATTDVGQEIVDLVVNTIVSCGDCSNPTDGRTEVFALSSPVTASPGLLPEIIYTDDGYVTSGDDWITTFAIGEDAKAIEIVGSNLVVISQSGLALHYSDKQAQLNGAPVWTKVATGFVAAHGPNDIAVASAVDVWMCGQGGYIYYTSDPTGGVSVQDAGVATVQNLNRIYAYNSDVVVSVGAANALVYTLDGQTWRTGVGPDVGHAPALNSVFCLTERIWFVGTADNALWVTEDQGTTWTQVRFTGDTSTGGGVGRVDDVRFASRDCGFMCHATSAPKGYVLR